MAAEIDGPGIAGAVERQASMRPRRMAAEIPPRRARGRSRRRASMRPRRMAAEIGNWTITSFDGRWLQ